ncbi:MAG: hypothetical protein AAFW73_21680 [Bacteroidota bacterium]
MLHQINIIVHVLAGCLAMLIGIVAYASTKGDKLHRRMGQIFLFLMGIVILTALNGVLFFIDRPFLTVVTLQSAYLSYTGYRVLRIRQSAWQTIDLGIMLLTLGVLAGFLWQRAVANVLWHQLVVDYLLLYLSIILLFDLLRYFRPKLSFGPRFWLYDHIFRMTSAFTALVSAGFGTVFATWEPLNQILPAVLGTGWLVFCLWYFPRKGKVKSA